MKNRKVIIIVAIVLILAAIITVILMADAPSFNDKYSSSEIYGKVANSFVTEGGMKRLDDDVILEFTDEELNYILDYIVVKANNAKNINEIGIFKVQNGSSNDLKKIISEYVKDKQQIYLAMDYFPEEVEKIDCARIFVMGNYVIYSFLNEKDTDSLYSAIKSLIQE